MKHLRTVFTLAFVLALAIAVAPAVITHAADAAPKDVTLKGEPVDITCYLGGKSGPGHAGCATACANKGNPIGFVVGEGDEKVMYLVLGDGGKAAKDLLASHMGAQVTVTGKASTKERLPVLVASKVEK